MQVGWIAGDEEHGASYREAFATYDEAASEARQQAAQGRTTVVYKALPVARFVAKVTVEAQELPECER